MCTSWQGGTRNYSASRLTRKVFEFSVMPIGVDDTSKLPVLRLLKIVALRLSAWRSHVLLKRVIAKLSGEVTT